jgi:hypothetical protein
MGFQGIDEVMEPLIALPARLHARLAVPLAGKDATELGPAPHHIAVYNGERPASGVAESRRLHARIETGEKPQNPKNRHS